MAVKLNPRSTPAAPGKKSAVYLSSKLGPVVARDAQDASDPDSPSYDPTSPEYDESLDDSGKQ